MTIIRLPPSTSSTSLIERSWPTASGIIVSGKATLSRSGSTGSASGSRCSSAASAAGSPFTAGTWIVMAARPGSWVRDRHAAAGLVRLRQRDLDLEDPVDVGRARLVRDDIRAELDDAPEGAVLDLDLLVEAPAGLGLGRAPLAGDHELASADLERDVRGVHGREVDLHDGARRVVRVVDVDPGHEAAPAQAAPPLEDVAEDLVHLTPHALEVREQVALGGHSDRE